MSGNFFFSTSILHSLVVQCSQVARGSNFSSVIGSTNVYFIVRERNSKIDSSLKSRKIIGKKKTETRLKEKSRDGCTFNLYLSYSKAPDNERPIDCTFIHCDFFLNEIVNS